MIFIIGYILLICIGIVTPSSGRMKSVYQKDLSEICKRKIISSVFLGTGVLETDSETLDFSKLELPYDCFVKVKAEPGSNIILVAQLESAENLEETCEQKPNQFLVLDMLNTFGGFWEVLANDFSTPDYKQRNPKRTWSLHNYHTGDDVGFQVQDYNGVVPIETTQNSFKFSLPLETQIFVDSKPTKNVQTIRKQNTRTSKSTKETDFKDVDIFSNDENHDHEHSIDNKIDSGDVSFLSKMKSFEKQDDSKDDSNDDDVDNEDYLEEEGLEPSIKVSLFSTARNIPFPYLRETSKPHIHFAPRYKNIISPKRPQTREEYSDFVDDGRLDYLQQRTKPLTKSTKYSSFIGYRAWQRQHGGNQPIQKYVDYDVEDKNFGGRTRKTAQKLKRIKVDTATSTVQYFFKVDEDRKSVTPNFNALSFRTRLRYFQDATTKSMKSTKKEKQNTEHKVPYFKLKTTTGNRFKVLRNKTIYSVKKNLFDSTEDARNEDEKLSLAFAKNQTSKNLISTKRRNTTLRYKLVKSRKKTTNMTTNAKAATSTTVSVSISKPYLITRKRNDTITKTPSNFTANTNTFSKMATNRDIKPLITVSPYKSILPAIPPKSMKSSQITTINEHDFLKQLLGNFRRKANNLPQIKSTANLREPALSTEIIKTIESPLHTVSTTLLSTGPIDYTLNQSALSTATTVTLKISIVGTVAPTRQDTFKPTNTTPVQSLESTFLDTSFRSTAPLKTTISVANFTETLITKPKATITSSLGKIAELPSRSVTTTNTLNTIAQTNKTLKSTATESDLLDLIKTKSIIHLSEFTFSKEGNSSFTTIKEELTKPAAKTTSQKETKINQENSIARKTVTTKQSSTKMNKDIKIPLKQLDVVVRLDNAKTSSIALTQKEDNNTQNVIPLKSLSTNRTIILSKATNVTQSISKTTLTKMQSTVATENVKHGQISLSTIKQVKTTPKELDKKSSQVKMFLAAKTSTTRKSVYANFPGGTNGTKIKQKNVTLFSAETWSKSTLAHKSWENLIQAAPDMISSLNRTKHIWKAKLKNAKPPKALKRVKRRLEYIPIEDSKPHMQEVMITTSRKPSRHTVNMDYYLADDQREEEYGRAHFGRLESYLGPVLYNICTTEQKKTRLVALFNSSTIIFIMNDFNLERLNLIVTSATTIAQTLSECPLNQLECQVSGVRVCIDMSSACDNIPNCGAYDIYDEDRILCGFNLTFKHSLILTAITFVVMIGIGVYSIHYWLERCIPNVSEAFFVYTDTAENVLYLDTIMRSPNATDDFPSMPYHVPEFEDGLKMRKRMVKRGLCSLLFGMICPCCKIFKPAAEAPISLEEFDKDHSDGGSHFEKMFHYSSGDMDNFAIPHDDKATQTSFNLGAIERAVSFHSKSKDSLINKLGDLRFSRSYHNELELIKKMRDNSEIRKEERSYSQDDSSSTIHTHRVTAEEEELRNTVYDMGIPISITPVHHLLSEHEIIGQTDEEIEGVLVEPTKRLRFNEHKAGPSEVPDKDKSKKSIDNRLRRTSVDLHKKKKQYNVF